MATAAHVLYGRPILLKAQVQVRPVFCLNSFPATFLCGNGSNHRLRQEAQIRRLCGSCSMAIRCQR
jgi:hypothetical protein